MVSVLETLKGGYDLSDVQVRELGETLLDMSVEVAEKAELLKALTSKGETAEEITAFVNCFLEKAVRPDLADVVDGYPTIDVCGTGGDQLDLFNVSTTSMFVIAAGGAKVIKHGNRGITSQSGGADVLEQLGIPVQSTEDQLRRALDEANACFLFAPQYHPAFAAVKEVRMQLAQEGVRTIFNLIGPLLNPAAPQYQMVGVTMQERTADFAQILQNLGREQVFAVTGYTAEGAPVDEFSTMGLNHLYKAKPGKGVKLHALTPKELGLEVSPLDALKGGDAVENAKTLVAILNGVERGARRDIVLLNAGAGLACCKIVDRIEEGVELAAELIESGKAYAQLEALQNIYR